MLNRLTTFSLSAAVLALAGLAPHASACSIPGMPPMKPAFVLPPGLIGSPHPTGSPVSIVGLWHVAFYSGGVLADNAFDAWHSDGTETLNDFTDPIEDNVCLGVWTQTASGSYKLKHPSWTFDTSGNLTGVALILEDVTVSGDGSSYTGTYGIGLFDTLGNPIGSFGGTLKAERITPD